MEGHDDGQGDQQHQGGGMGKKRPNESAGEYAAPQKKGFFNGEALTDSLMENIYFIVYSFHVCRKKQQRTAGGP